VQVPVFLNMLKLPFPVALFLGNVVSVAMTGYLVPLVAARMGWWLQPTRNVLRANLLGAALIVALYAVCVFIFWKFF
jgi:uncharacterized protein